VCKVLVQRGAQMDIQNIYEETALSQSLKDSSDTIALMLIREGADVNLHSPM